jgi:hypothetical protein
MCRLVNPDESQCCDCGYDFDSGKIQSPYLTRHEAHSSDNAGTSQRPQTEIRYRLHFTLLLLAFAAFCAVIGPYTQSGTPYTSFMFGFMGFLHATCISASLRTRSSKQAAKAILFVTLATVLSYLVPTLAVYSSFLLTPILERIPDNRFNFLYLYLPGSAIGASGYWLLVRLFWVRALRLADWLKTVLLCMTATLVSTVACELVLHRYPLLFFPIVTAVWWCLFSTSIYWSESGYSASADRAIRSCASKAGLMRKELIGLGVSLVSVPFLLVVWYLAAVRWAPMDTLTMALPQGVRNTISYALVARANFDAKGFPAAKRAVKLNPSSEDAWTMSCATGVSAGYDMEGALEACSRAASMTNMMFHAQVIAEAYEEAHRPCDGLPVLKKTMGEEEVSNISRIFSVGRLEVTCGQMEAAEKHLRAVVRLRAEDLRPFNWEDRPPGADGPPDSYEKAFRLYLSEARQNLSALLTLRHKDEEAFHVCRSALGTELKRCSCHFTPRNGVACDSSAAE